MQGGQQFKKAPEKRKREEAWSRRTREGESRKQRGPSSRSPTIHRCSGCGRDCHLSWPALLLPKMLKELICYPLSHETEGYQPTNRTLNELNTNLMKARTHKIINSLLTIKCLGLQRTPRFIRRRWGRGGGGGMGGVLHMLGFSEIESVIRLRTKPISEVLHGEVPKVNFT